MVTAAAMDEIYANIDVEKPANSTSRNNQTGPRSSERRFPGCVALCLGLLCVFLLIGLICLGVIYYDSLLDSSTRLSEMKANLTEQLQDKDDKLSFVSKERDLLGKNVTEMAKELERLRKKRCPAGWKKFSCTCYFFSTKNDTWNNGLQDCKNKGADLVIIESKEEQNFITQNIKQDYWIGLNDKDKEGTWKWTDGTALTLSFWFPDQPNNGRSYGEEDCVNIKHEMKGGKNWNDLRCDAHLQWICEKLL